MPDRNEITVSGRLYRVPAEDPSVGDGVLMVERRSGRVDMVPFVMPWDTLGRRRFELGARVQITGSLRIRPRSGEPGGPKWMLAVQVESVEPARKGAEDVNRVVLHGVLNSDARYRETPFGREITDIMLTVARPSVGVDHVPCVAWGLTARWAGALETGERVAIEGRFQSRQYQKVLPDGARCFTAFEISAVRNGVRRVGT